MQKLVFDYVIIGAGPVGLYAGTKLSKTKKSFIILEKNKKVGGQPLYIYPEKKITNFPNTKSISGSSVSKKIVGKNKLNIQTKCEVKNIKIIGNKKIKVIAAKDNFICNKVLICSGLGKIEHITIDFLESNPKVIYEITNIKILKDKRIIILGGGDAASDYAAQLKDVCKTITVVYRGDAMKNNRKLEQNVKYYLGWNLIGSPYSDGLEIEDIKTKSRLTIPFDYILVQYGYKFSNSKSLFKKIKTKNERILVDKKTQKTNIENIFACGDCCTYKGKEFTIKSGFDEIDRLKLK